jgi:hypothetical protein
VGVGAGVKGRALKRGAQAGVPRETSPQEVSPQETSHPKSGLIYQQPGGGLTTSKSCFGKQRWLLMLMSLILTPAPS